MIEEREMEPIKNFYFNDHKNALYIDYYKLVIADYDNEYHTIESLINKLADMFKIFALSLDDIKKNSIERAITYTINNENNVKNKFHANMNRKNDIFQENMLDLTTNKGIQVRYNIEYNTIDFLLSDNIHKITHNFQKYIEFMSYFGPIRIGFKHDEISVNPVTFKYLNDISQLENVVEMFLYYSHKDLQFIKFPKNLKYLYINFSQDALKVFNNEIGFNFPTNLDTINIAFCGYFMTNDIFDIFYNNIIDKLPASVSCIEFINVNNYRNNKIIFLTKSYCIYPHNLKRLILNIGFAVNFGDLPPTLEYIHINMLCTSITNLPTYLKSLKIDSVYISRYCVLDGIDKLYKNSSIKITNGNIEIDFTNNYFNENLENFIISDSIIYILKNFSKFPDSFKKIIIKTDNCYFLKDIIVMIDYFYSKKVVEMINSCKTFLKRYEINKYGTDESTMAVNFLRSPEFKEYLNKYGVLNLVKNKHKNVSYYTYFAIR